MSPASKLNIAVACGGTGGHTFPGLATARVLRARGHNVTLWMAGRDIEEQTVKGWESPVFKTGARQLRKNPAAMTALWRSLMRSRRGLRQQSCDVLLAMGSYASLPPVLAARLARVPIVLHEANTIPGKAVATLSRFRATAISFARARWLPRARVVQTDCRYARNCADSHPSGVPATAWLHRLHHRRQQGHMCSTGCAARRSRSGARAPGAALRVIHQTGAADEAAVRAAYEAAGIDAQVFAFLGQMGRLQCGRSGHRPCRCRHLRRVLPLRRAVAAGAAADGGARPPARQRRAPRRGRGCRMLPAGRLHPRMAERLS